MAMKTFLVVFSLAAVDSEVTFGRQDRMRQKLLGSCFGKAAVRSYHDATTKCFAAAAADAPSAVAAQRFPADAIQKLVMAAQSKSGTMINAKFGKLWKATSQFVESLERQRMEAYRRMDLVLCPFKELGLLDDNMELEFSLLIKTANALQFKDERSREESKSSSRICFAKIHGMGDSYFKGMVTPKREKVEMWYDCVKAIHTSYCADELAKEMLETKFGSVSKLIEATGMEEKALLDVAQNVHI